MFQEGFGFSGACESILHRSYTNNRTYQSPKYPDLS